MSGNPTQEIPDSRSFEDRVFARFDALDARIDGFESRIEAKVDGLDGRLTTLEEKVDTRLRETRPLWEAVQARLGGVENRLEGVENRLGGVENGLEGLKGEVKKLTHTVMLVHEDNLLIRANHRELFQRVEKLESQSTR
jgi:archaellum component FlaC